MTQTICLKRDLKHVLACAGFALWWRMTRTYRRLGLVGIAIATLAAAVAFLAVEDKKPRPQRATPARYGSAFTKGCAPHAEAPIVIGEATLRVPLRALSLISFVDDRFEDPPCPATPIPAREILFYDRAEELVDLYRQHRLRLFYLKIGDPSRQLRLEIPAYSAPLRTWAVPGGRIEEITDSFRPGDETTRTYLLRHFGPENESPTMMICGGDPVNGLPRSRMCRAFHLFEGQLNIKYEFRQDGRNRRDERVDLGPPGAIAEPEGLLEVDSNVRGMLRALMID